jgi:hypothetical protein
LDDRIRELCANAVAIPESAELTVEIERLKNALHEHADNMRSMAANRAESPQRRQSDAAAAAARLVKCTICGHPIALEIAKVDEDGDAVHEGCYVVKLRARPKPKSAAPQITAA